MRINKQENALLPQRRAAKARVARAASGMWQGVGVRPCMTDLPRIYMLYVHALCAGGRAYVRGITRHSDRVQPGSNMAIMFGLKTNLMDVFQAFEGTGVELTQKVLLKWE